VEKPVGSVDNFMHKGFVENLSFPPCGGKMTTKKIVQFYKTRL
jgi:hypothetical protein